MSGRRHSALTCTVLSLAVGMGSYWLFAGDASAGCNPPECSKASDCGTPPPGYQNRCSLSCCFLIRNPGAGGCAPAGQSCSNPLYTGCCSGLICNANNVCSSSGGGGGACKGQGARCGDGGGDDCCEFLQCDSNQTPAVCVPETDCGCKVSRCGMDANGNPACIDRCSTQDAHCGPICGCSSNPADPLYAPGCWQQCKDACNNPATDCCQPTCRYLCGEDDGCGGVCPMLNIPNNTVCCTPAGENAKNSCQDCGTCGDGVCCTGGPIAYEGDGESNYCCEDCGSPCDGRPKNTPGGTGCFCGASCTPQEGP